MYLSDIRVNVKSNSDEKFMMTYYDFISLDFRGLMIKVYKSKLLWENDFEYHIKHTQSYLQISNRE